MKINKLLIANRGEIAIRIARAAADIGIKTVSVYSTDDQASQHLKMTDESYSLGEAGVSAYLNMNKIIEIAKLTESNAIHPGYGFLSENSEFAKKCVGENITFVGPSVEILDLFGNKGTARKAAKNAGVPILKGLYGTTTIEEAREFFESLKGSSGIMLKAIAGGGGRGTRAVLNLEDLEKSFKRCQSEAKRSFGNGDLYVEEFLPIARHIEVQIVGDIHGSVTHLWERECSTQRRYQKILEIAPAPFLSQGMKTSIINAAIQLAKSVSYDNLGTFEFLVYASTGKELDAFAFIEGNARLQVEHTVTEEVTGVDIVQSQIRLAEGSSLTELGIDDPNKLIPRGYAIQARINGETIASNGQIRPSSGKLTTYETPGGPGIRTDGFCYVGYETGLSFDSLLVKLICYSSSNVFEDAINKTIRALKEFKISGVQTNINFHINLLRNSDFLSGNLYTRFIDEHIVDLVDETEEGISNVTEDKKNIDQDSGLAGATITSKDPLALFSYDKKVKSDKKHENENLAPEEKQGPKGSIPIIAPIQGTILNINVALDSEIYKGQPLLVMEAMKMEHTITSEVSGIIKSLTINEGDTVKEGHPLIFIQESEVSIEGQHSEETVDLDYIRPDLRELLDRKKITLDENRPKAVERRRNKNQRTARENIEQLCDYGSFVEFGQLVTAAQRSRHSEEWLMKNTPTDGLICGIATINSELFDADEDSRFLAVSYDYTVFAGTQGKRNHYKQDRVYELARKFRLPVVLFGEGGGGRPGDDSLGGIGMDTTTFTTFSTLSGLVPMVGVVSGRCFAGNTALIACCDVIIATENSTIGMGGPAMIEAGGLGVYTPEEVGPLSFQVPNGVVDILVKNEEEAVEVTKKYLSYFQGSVENWEENDQRILRHVVPENRKKIYDMREIIETIADKDSVLEIRENFGVGIFTAFIRIEGKPMGLIANNPHHLAGAIDSDASDKAARFLQLCDAFDIPILSLMDCPGLMVGPEVEKTALVRHCGRLFNTGANLSVPMFGVIVRKAYGLGVQAMCGGGSMVPFFTIAWPTAEFAGMAIEGGVKLGYRKEMEAMNNTEDRVKFYEEMVANGYETAKAVNAATNYGIDDIIDPSDTRKWLVSGLRSLPPIPIRTTKKRPYIDTW
jgi:acetyl/propionyl-CoA carboxylase alpha subunit/acetyl-CoA carboxylase carboxyltransferase component